MIANAEARILPLQVDTGRTASRKSESRYVRVRWVLAVGRINLSRMADTCPTCGLCYVYQAHGPTE